MKKLLKNKKVLIPSIVVAVVLVVILSCVLFYTANLGAVRSTKENVAFEVTSGETTDSVISRLEDKKLIKNTMVTKIYMKLHGLNDIKAGTFTLDRSWTTKEILQTLSDVNKAKDGQAMITFREGMWAKDVAALIEQEMGIPKDELIALWNDDAYINELMNSYPFLTKDVLNPEYRIKLEGFLFPETYTFKKDATAKEITKTFLDHFQTIYDTYETEINNSELNIHEIITLASVVQYEASSKQDMDMIAGVFYNRLAADMPLQSSVTVCYALYDDLTSSDDCEIQTDIDSPYNTYRHPGLPIGAILNPGEEAIHAVLNPKKNDYLYFVADIYGDGSVYYAKTLDEHEANIDKYNLRK